MYILCFPFGHLLARPLTQVLGNIQSQDLLGYLLHFWPLPFIGCPLDLLVLSLYTCTVASLYLSTKSIGIAPFSKIASPLPNYGHLRCQNRAQRSSLSH